jgi:hypothetical protein
MEEESRLKVAKEGSSTYRVPHDRQRDWAHELARNRSSSCPIYPARVKSEKASEKAFTDGKDFSTVTTQQAL